MSGSAVRVDSSEIVPLVDEGLGNSSYLVALGDGRALVLDPSRDPNPYLKLADDLNLRMAFAVETHLHADFISGSRELAAFGAAIIAPRESHLATEYRGLGDGEEVDLGGLTLRALATPGHTPEDLAYLLLEGPKPLAMFSGHYRFTLLAYNLQKPLFGITVVSAMVSSALCFPLIHEWGATGAAAALVAGNVVTLVLVYRCVGRHVVEIRLYPSLRPLLRKAL